MRAVSKANGHLRIIGGRNRGRKVPVVDAPGLRPTGDRVRETLFNWLAPVISGARCLDLFAGTGALGFEAASRGAAEVVMIERSEPVVRALRANALDLGDTGIRIVKADALDWLARDAEPFDIVFLDPPFDDRLLGRACSLLSHGGLGRSGRGSAGWLAPGALVYLETSAKDALPSLPADWVLVRDKRAGQVRFGLAAVGGEAASSF